MGHIACIGAPRGRLNRPDDSAAELRTLLEHARARRRARV